MEWKSCVTDHRADVAQNRGIEGTLFVLAHNSKAMCFGMNQKIA